MKKNHKSRKTKLFHLYYITLHDKLLHLEKKILHKHSQNKYLFITIFLFLCFISAKFADFASLKIQMQITFAKSFNVLMPCSQNF